MLSRSEDTRPAAALKGPTETQTSAAHGERVRAMFAAAFHRVLQVRLLPGSPLPGDLRYCFLFGQFRLKFKRTGFIKSQTKLLGIKTGRGVLQALPHTPRDVLDGVGALVSTEYKTAAAAGNDCGYS